MSSAQVAARLLGAVLAVAGVLFWADAARAQPPQAAKAEAKSEAERLLSQKAVMLEAYLASQRVAESLRAGEPKTVEAVERARADLADGAEALGKGDLKRAEQSLNAGLRQISTLRLQQGANTANPIVKKEEFKSRRKQIDSFIRALEAGSDASALSPWTGRLVVARKSLEQADALYEQEKFTEAHSRLVSIYEDVVVIVSEARRNQSIVYRLSFATPADEFAYELQRNKSYEILVDIAISEQKNPDKALRPFIMKLVSESQELREKAAAEAAKGDHVAAIGTIESATRHLVQALRSAGVMVME